MDVLICVDWLTKILMWSKDRPQYALNNCPRLCCYHYERKNQLFGTGIKELSISSVAWAILKIRKDLWSEQRLWSWNSYFRIWLLLQASSFFGSGSSISATEWFGPLLTESHCIICTTRLPHKPGLWHWNHISGYNSGSTVYKFSAPAPAIRNYLSSGFTALGWTKCLWDLFSSKAFGCSPFHTVWRFVWIKTCSNQGPQLCIRRPLCPVQDKRLRTCVLFKLCFFNVLVRY